jgi:hypothetical protein
MYPLLLLLLLLLLPLLPLPNIKTGSPNFLNRLQEPNPIPAAAAACVGMAQQLNRYLARQTAPA